MKDMFLAGELAKLQKISKQTLLFYDKIGLFSPNYIDPQNGYRYYSADQLDYLDTILIMKKIGFPLNEIKEHMKSYTTENSLAFLRKQLDVIEKDILELTMIKNRLERRCEQVEQAFTHGAIEPEISRMSASYLLYYDVNKPFGMKEISVATKKCYAQALEENLPIFFQCGVCVPLKHIKEGRYTEAVMAFVTSDDVKEVQNIKELPEGQIVSTYHFGNYYDIGNAYKRIMDYCERKNLEIISDSYEFCINDYITSRDEEEFITKIIFYIQSK